MAFWFYRGLRKGIVTTRFPRSIDLWTRDLPSPPAFHSRHLTGAVVDALVAACPSGTITREGPELVIDLGRCSGCGRCLELAGDAVTSSGAFLLATDDRAALIKRVPIPGERGRRQ